ncbi:leukocyte immunoglobulin-like receptor subfamily B member 3A isoform X1 [Mesocricetus auratus]|uniref:Leukocyte immunoglobulin-like receptor subfamily B member 3A isoform X1 n=1 Tax=Mesocricetus auratus TaxID=10036 RepID=A0A3Q0DEY7_MESAU|nr:leukocyte immunoglobulin-like receptor subfamily B member 3A isoform X1 [Mesocricetus auratus]
MTGTLSAFLCFGLTLGLRNSVLTWRLPKPLIRAEPGSVVTNGSRVTILCEGTSGAQSYYLYQDGKPGSWYRMTLMKPGNMAKFLIPFTERSHAGRYLCLYHKLHGLSEKSDTLELVVTGYYTKPILSALTSLVVTSGENMTFQCVSWERYNSFILTKEDEKFSRPQDSQYINSTGHSQALFHIGSVTVSHRGMFRCYGYKNSTYMWSEPSDPLEIHIAGQLKVAPTLLVHPGSIVSSGENVILLCQSWRQMDTFLLSKEGTAHPPLCLRSVLQTGLYQAKFSLTNVTFAYGGTYKCYSSEDSSPYMLSQPSNPVELVVSEFSGDPNSSLQEPIPTYGVERHLNVLFVIAVTLLLLLFLLTLLLLQCKHQDKRRKKAQRETIRLQLLTESAKPVTRDRVRFQLLPSMKKTCARARQSWRERCPRSQFTGLLERFWGPNSEEPNPHCGPRAFLPILCFTHSLRMMGILTNG